MNPVDNIIAVRYTTKGNTVRFVVDNDSGLGVNNIPRYLRCARDFLLHCIRQE